MVATPPGNYGSEHLLLTFHGTLPGGESWSCGLRTVAGTIPVEELQTYATYVAGAWDVIIMKGSNAGMNPPDVTFEGCTVRQLTIAGVTQYLAEGKPAAASKGAGSVVGANQLAMAISLRTNVAGRHGKGRIYFPTLSLASTATGGVAPAATAQLALTFKTFLELLNQSDVASTYTGAPTKPAAFFRIAIQSRTSGQPGAPVTQVAVGHIIDTIRGRRTSLRETYALATVLPPAAM